MCFPCAEPSVTQNLRADNQTGQSQDRAVARTIAAAALFLDAPPGPGGRNLATLTALPSTPVAVPHARPWPLWQPKAQSHG